MMELLSNLSMWTPSSSERVLQSDLLTLFVRVQPLTVFQTALWLLPGSWQATWLTSTLLYTCQPSTEELNWKPSHRCASCDLPHCQWSGGARGGAVLCWDDGGVGQRHTHQTNTASQNGNFTEFFTWKITYQINSWRIWLYREVCVGGLDQNVNNLTSLNWNALNKNHHLLLYIS